MIDPTSRNVQRTFVVIFLTGFLSLVAGVPVAALLDRPHLFFFGIIVCVLLLTAVIVGLCLYLWIGDE